ncbi:hypothetical protein MTBLM5_130002 [Magnetospirillum sp. LM-5]|nr:hypothetical protein MTBLM5_130002 [Magnetospirillum sp. LM-5]
MSLAEFKTSPWAKSHLGYSGSTLSLTPAPEYANSEVLVHRSVPCHRLGRHQRRDGPRPWQGA